MEVAKRGSVVRKERGQLAPCRRGTVPEFKLTFESARTLFSELMPARVDLLDILQRLDPCSA
jgi:hypothetical protein